MVFFLKRELVRPIPFSVVTNESVSLTIKVKASNATVTVATQENLAVSNSSNHNTLGLR